jgi:SAM-dependent methyltransferase
VNASGAAIAPAPPSDASAVTECPWDKAAAGWNEHSESIHDWLYDVTRAMLDAVHITEGSRVLDIAAGAGDQTLDIARRVGPSGYVLATDISRPILALAQENSHKAGLLQIATQVADAQALGLGGANFDAAVCRLGLMFCLKPLDALIEARKALKPGGRLGAVVFSHSQHNPCLTIMMATALRHAGLPPRPAFAPGTLLSLGQPGLLEQLLQEAGFIGIHVLAMSAPFRMLSGAHYIDFVKAGGSPIMEVLAPLSTRAQSDAWCDMSQQLDVFTTATGWEGPNELLLCSAKTPS